MMFYPPVIRAGNGAAVCGRYAVNPLGFLAQSKERQECDDDDDCANDVDDVFHEMPLT
jgi:hypothetical protein